MTRTARAPRQPEQGFGLLELIITLVLTTLVLGGIMSTFFRTANQAERLTDVADLRQGARSAIQLVEREIRMAGSGWGRIPVYGNNCVGVADILQAVRPGYSATSTNDSLVLVGAWGTSTTTTATMSLSTSATVVASVAGFRDGDLIIITNGTDAHMMQVTGVNSVTLTLNHNPAAPYNTNAGFVQWPGSGYRIGSSVYKATISSYSYDATTYRKPVLLRHEYGSPPQVVAYNVNGFRVWYEMQDGTWTRNPVPMSSVDKVSPVVITRVTDPRQPALTDSVWAAVQPRTF